MKILLVNPPCRTPALIPLGLGYIASILRLAKHDVRLMDLNADRKERGDIVKQLAEINPEVIGIGGLTTTYSFVKDFSLLAKSALPKTKIIAGNMVSTSTPELLLKNSAVDICVIDEGEYTADELIQKIDSSDSIIKDVKGIVFKEGANIITTPPRERIDNLDLLPFPAWDLFPMETYINNPIYNEYGRRSINVTAVRGCPFQCIYCSRPFGSRVHRRSAESIISEVKELKRRYRIEFVGFSDDLFMDDRRWVEDVCDKMAREGLGIGWGTSARVNLVDEDILAKMKRAGCELLVFGFESGSQKILNIMKKGVRVEQAEKAIRITRKAGIQVQGSFMIGMIGETEETVAETVDFIKRTGLTMHRFFYTTPYPKTPLYDMAKKMNRIPDDEDRYVSSLGEMRSTFLVNLTDLPDERLKELKERSEARIRANFSLKARIEILSDDIRRNLAENGFLKTVKKQLLKLGKKAVK